ncbi:MAG TPA: response regulator [Myxococcales bacterium]|jgi:CheY-like chemotaxis protein
MRPLNVLVVDDDPALVSAARALLARRGCRLDAVFSGLDAVARVRAGGIDAVLMDVWMPEVDGLSALEEICRLPNPPRVVLMSGHIDQKVEAAVLQGRAIACLPKPVDFDLALTLLSGEAPETPLQLRIALDPTDLTGFAAQVLSRGTAVVEAAPQLPTGTAVSLVVELVSGQVTLVGVAEASVRPTGKRGLGLKFAELTEAQQQALRAVGGQLREALPIRSEATQNRARELYLRGLEKLEAGEYETAQRDLKAARDLNPGDVLLAAAALRAEELAGIEKARLLFRESQKLSEPHEALRMVEEAIRLDPSRATYHREAAKLYLQQGDAMQQAEERLAAAIHLAPSDPEPRLHLVQLLERAGRPKEAFWACEAAMGLFPGDAELLKLAARLRRKAGSTI